MRLKWKRKEGGLIMYRKLITLEHDEKEKRVWIVFCNFEDNNKSTGFEEAILEDNEFYDLVKSVLVKWGKEKVKK